MERSGPLIPLPLLLFLIALVVVSLVVSARPYVKVRWPGLLPELASFAALLLIHLVFFWQPYRSEAVVPAGGGDLASFFYPIHAFAAREIQHGRFPFWDPHQLSGMPHLANFQTGALYPPNLIAYLLARPFSYATLELLAILHFLIASIGVYLLARVLGIGRPGSVLAGSIFAYSGFLVAHLGHYSMLSTIAWSPFVYAAIIAVVRYRSWLVAWIGTLALALSVLGGHQPILLMILTFALVLAAFEIWRATGYLQPGSWRMIFGCHETQASLLRLGFMAGVAFVLTLPVLGPAFELTRYSVRSGLSYQQASEFSVEPIALIQMILPTVFGSNPTDYWGAFSNSEIWGYAGVIALLLAAYGIAVRSRSVQLFWLATAIVGVLYIVGPFTSIHGLAYAFAPGFDRIRGAGRGYAFVDLAVAILAGFGLQQLLISRRNWSPRQATVTRLGLIGLAGLSGIVAFIIVPLFANTVLGVNDPSNRPVIALDNINLLGLWLVLALGAGIAVYRGRLAGNWLVGVLIAITLIDIFHATSSFNPTTSPILQGFNHPGIVQFLRERQTQDGPFRIESQAEGWQPDTARLLGLDDIGGLVDPLALADYDQYLGTARADRSSDQYRALNARYLMLDEQAAPPVNGMSAVLQSDGLTVWQYDDARPRAWIEGQPDIHLDIDATDSDRLRIELPDGVPAGRLIVSQAYYPGWSARVDGAEISIERYQSALQAVPIAAGTRTVTLDFRPTFWYGWLAMAGIGALVWIGTGCALFMRRRRDQGVKDG